MTPADRERDNDVPGYLVANRFVPFHFGETLSTGLEKNPTLKMREPYKSDRIFLFPKLLNLFILSKNTEKNQKMHKSLQRSSVAGFEPTSSLA